MEMSHWFQSKKIKVVIAVIAEFVVILVAFGTGMAVGFHKADFSYRWGENYHRNFGGPRRGFFENFSGRDFINAHGVSGVVIKNDATGSALVVRGKDNVEKIISTNDRTVIRRMGDTIKMSDVIPGDMVVAIGDPDNTGKIEAKFLRVFPATGGTTTPQTPEVGGGQR